jgi:hypothetical protein
MKNINIAKCSTCGNEQEEKYKFCQKCLVEMPKLLNEKEPPKQIRHLGKLNIFLKFYPLAFLVLSFFGIVLFFGILIFSLHIPFASKDVESAAALFYFFFVRHIAILRGRSGWWGFLLPIGLIILEILPIKNNQGIKNVSNEKTNIKKIQ